MAKRKTEKDYHKLAENRGFKWISKHLPKTAHHKTWWECKNGHRWKARYSDVRNGSGCPFCNKNSEQDYNNVGKSRFIEWAGLVLPKNIKTKTLWKCKNKHMWLAAYTYIYNGNGCPICSGRIKKVTKDYYNLAISRGFKWVGVNLPKNIQTKTLWKCENGHKWEARYNDIRNGHGCPRCLKKTKEDYYKLAEDHGFKWVGKVLPKNVITKTLWECGKGHRWKAIYSNIRSGSCCSFCDHRINGVKVSKQQIKLNSLLFGSLNYPEGRYRIDVAIMRKSQKIAVEYDAQYWHKGREKEDTKRDKFLILKGWKTLHIKSRNLLPTRKKLNIAIKHLLETNDVMYNMRLRDWKH